MSVRWKRRFPLFVLAVTLAVGASFSAGAHERKQVGEWRVTFGMTPEPVFAGQFYKTTWRFVGAEGQPVTGLENLTVTILYDGKPYGPFAVSPAHGEPGLYEVPTIFASPGVYRFILSGGDGLEVEFTKDVLDANLITVGG